MQLAPVVLFVYNRPQHAQRTLAALQANEYASLSDLIIFSDGPKNERAAEKVKEVRNLIHTTPGFRSVTVHASPVNKGLARSIIDGVTRVCHTYGRAIVVEDDLVTSRWFLKFMNDALGLYEQDRRVASITGHSIPVKGLPETFFLRGTECWGWATWARAWNLFDPDGPRLLERLRAQNRQHEFDMDGAFPYTRMLKDQIRGRNDSWAIRWHASALLLNLLTLFPGASLVDNIGHDGSGTHCGINESLRGAVATRPISVTRIPVRESAPALASWKQFLLNGRRSFGRRVRDRLVGMVHHAVRP